jgi:AAA+ superfamily predicted ATPase
MIRSKLVEMSPTRFYALTAVMTSMSDDTRQWLEKQASVLKELSTSVVETEEKLGKSVRAMDGEIRSTVRRKAPTTFDEYEDAGKDLRHTMGQDTNFLRVSHNLVSSISKAYQTVHEMTEGLLPGELVLFRKNATSRPAGRDEFQDMIGEMELNHAQVKRFVESCTQLETVDIWLSNFLGGVEQVMSMYHKALLDRHSVQGIQVHKDPVLTDIAITIYENIDAHGEVEDGKSPDEVSSYTLRKAEILARALKDDFTHGLTQRPDKINDVVTSSFLTMHAFTKELRTKLGPQLDAVLKAVGEPRRRSVEPIEYQLEGLSDLSPMTVVYRDKNVLMTAEERFNLEFKNETIRQIVTFISDRDLDIQDLIKFVLERKAKLRKYFQEENSFYVCKIGHGNPFLGEAPGALQVIPGTRPNVKMDEILGSGFDEVREFANSIEQSAQWHDLFVATSPSKSADKSNVLLVGPMGCGKTEVLRAVGGDRGSIAIFAQGSDFNTCWKGEAEKNPKRLFEQAVKLQKEARRHVHICIDEIDSILNNDKEYGSTNLNLEFQILMDGVVQYPSLSVWGATNNIERIPMPMIRRFNKVLIVGELSQADRVKLLKMFLDYLPLGDVNDGHFDGWAKRLDGATGDVLRKIADVVWRKKMTEFVKDNKVAAQTVQGFLNAKNKFRVSEFKPAERQEFKRLLGQHMRVTPDDVDESVRANLRNVGVMSEITTAKETYSNAKRFLAHLASTL